MKRHRAEQGVDRIGDVEILSLDRVDVPEKRQIQRVVQRVMHIRLADSGGLADLLEPQLKVAGVSRFILLLVKDRLRPMRQMFRHGVGFEAAADVMLDVDVAGEHLTGFVVHPQCAAVRVEIGTRLNGFKPEQKIGVAGCGERGVDLNHVSPLCCHPIFFRSKPYRKSGRN